LTTLQAIILGIVQGATEFIPVSSSGHLVLVPWLLNWPSPGLTFDIAVHLGTVVAVWAYFWRDWWAIFSSASRWIIQREEADDQTRLLGLLLLGSIPAGVIGLLFRDFFEQAFNTPGIAALLLLVTAGLLLTGERLGKLSRRINDLTWRDGLFVGVGQALALFPGISRSGSTIAAGRVRNLSRDDAARFSFLLSTPLITALGLQTIYTLIRDGVARDQLMVLAIGFFTAGVTGYLVIYWLLRFLRTRSTSAFAIYLILFSVLCLIVLCLRAF
jgi:undecaprenyl-diphosphatase